MAASARLTRALHQQLGAELSRELLSWMGQMDSTRSELTAFHEEFTTFAIRTNGRLDALELRIDGFDQRFDRLEQRFERFELRLERFEEKFDKRHQDLMKWLFTCWCGSVFAIVAVVLAAR